MTFSKRSWNIPSLAGTMITACVLVQTALTGCTYIYGTQRERGELIRSQSIGEPEATGFVSLTLFCDVHRDGTLALAVTRRLERQQRVRREYRTQLLANRDVEESFEPAEPETSLEGLSDVRLALMLTSLTRSDAVRVERHGSPPATGKTTVDLRGLIPSDESLVLLEVEASATLGAHRQCVKHRTSAAVGGFRWDCGGREEARGVDALCSGVLSRQSDGYRLDASDSAVAGARKSMADLKAEVERQRQVAAAEDARQRAAMEEAQRRAEAEKEAQEKRAREQKKRAREEQIARVCPKGVGSLQDLVVTNPYDVEGRCFQFAGTTLQLLGRSEGLYSVSSNLSPFYINFGLGSAPPTFYSGYVKGVGPYTYQSVTGADQIVPYLKATELPAEPAQ